ncbi:MAG: ribosome assembly factor SBDS [Candidatus Methanomethylophilaceae archaeon]|nr:ribosome assembly factor SBDS [Candidatus Methanomethylophilaceae archaeon]MBR2394217.1 ribosome assembly factor SBDS [Candidatus Methanomethylophilaceae archaeon]MBR7124438.1 ribosome assembly factor SBDS [Candidatus Methanomethylophilaceae archaeon]
MVNLDDAIVARLETHGETFEILLDPSAMNLLKAGKEIDLLEYLAVEDVFNNARKGTRPAEDKIREAFGTSDVKEIAERIIAKGEVQITAEQRKEMLQAKKQQVITYIAANAINPQTKLPHPPMRIEMALEEAKFHADPFKSVDRQVEEAMKLLRPLLPIKFEKTKVAIKMKGDDYGKCYDDLIHFGLVEKEEWQSDGSWIGIIEIPAGLIDELKLKIGNKTKGSATFKELRA